ncbi:MAG: hypothetical protein JOY58_02835, partial [Solirubrobacterales bacterium]|nr:hypothetical protein [Solirubrobacterales bacterium]
MVVLGWVVVAVVGMWAAATISDSLTRSFDAPGRPAFDANRQIVEQFGTGGEVAPIVLVTQAPDRRAASRRFERVARTVAGGRVALPTDRGGKALVSEDGRTFAALVFPPPGHPEPDTNPQAVAALTRAAVGTGVRVTGIDALNQARGGGTGV